MPPIELQTDLISSLAREDQWDQIRAMLFGQHPADLADLITQSTSEFRNRLFSQIDDEAKPDVLAELEGRAEQDILRALTNAEISEIVEEMSPDDAADLIADLSEERSEKVLDLLEDEESEEVRELLKYDEESAGGIMTTELLVLPDSITVQEALNRVGTTDSDEPIYYAYVVDTDSRFVGYTSLWEMLRFSEQNAPLASMVSRDAVTATTSMDQEEVAKLMSKYDLTALPVVDESDRLVGRITIDDVIDVLEEEASEDIFRLAGSNDSELTTSSPIEACRIRLPWILITLISGFVTSLLLKGFMDSMTEILVLTIFVPIVLAMGGSTGIQSSTLVVRSIALGTIGERNLLRLLGREFATGAMMGGFCGIAMGVWTKIIVTALPDTTLAFSPTFLAFVVGFALFCAMVFAALYGAFVPILLNHFKVDPAVASGPFVTASNDIAALVIYYGITLSMITAFAP